MRVLLACPYDWDAPGGVQVHVRELAKALRSRGHETLVLTPGRTSASEDDVRIVGTPIRVPYGGKVAPICFSRASWRRIRHYVDVFEPDVVHAHEPFSPSTSMLTVLASSAPSVATFHAFHERSRLLAVAAPLLRSVARKLGASIAVSEAAAEFVAAIVDGGIEVVPNGINVDRWSRAKPAGDLPAGRKLLWASRLDPQKGFDVAVRAFARLATEFHDLVFVVAGEGRGRDAVEHLSPAIRARVDMLGAIPNVELPRYHVACDVFVAPATGHESFGIVLIEALAAGLPVVASDIPGYREVIHDGVDGLLAPPSDHEAVASAIARVLRESTLARELSRAGRERAREFSWDVVAPGSRPSTNGRVDRDEAVATIARVPAWGWVVVAVVVIALVAAVLIYNRLVALRNRVDNGWSQIDVQLRRRYDLIPNLVRTVQGYAAHERGLFESVTEARARAIDASAVKDQADAENQITQGLRRLMAVAEAYPDLKANEGFLALQEELTGTESKIAYARQFYNDQVMRLNTLIGSFPSSAIAGSFGFREREFFDIEDPVRAPATVEFS